MHPILPPKIEEPTYKTIFKRNVGRCGRNNTELTSMPCAKGKRTEAKKVSAILNGTRANLTTVGDSKYLEGQGLRHPILSCQSF